MEVITDSISVFTKNQYLDLCDKLRNEQNMQIVVGHFGTFTSDFVSRLTESIEELFISRGDSSIVRKRIFSILIEGLANVRKHGDIDENSQQIGYLIIASNDDLYKIVMANLVDNTHRELVESYVKKINSYSEFELNSKYSDVLKNEFLTDSGGSGLGLITTRIKTGNELSSSCFKVNEMLDLFSFDVSLSRKL